MFLTAGVKLPASTLATITCVPLDYSAASTIAALGSTLKARLSGDGVILAREAVAVRWYL